MFGRLGRLLDNINSLDEEIIFFRIIGEAFVQDFIIDLNRFDQLFKESQTADGGFVKGVYSDRTGFVTSQVESPSITYRNSKGETFSRTKDSGDSYFLLDSGAFYNSFDVEVSGNDFVIVADTIKTDKNGSTVLKDFGQILGLTDESKGKLVQEVLPFVVGQVRNILLS